MLIDPSIDKITEKTEDRYLLVNLASQRARDIVSCKEKELCIQANKPVVLDRLAVPPLTDDPCEKEVSQASREYSEGYIDYVFRRRCKACGDVFETKDPDQRFCSRSCEKIVQ